MAEKVVKTKKVAKPAEHPTYAAMIITAVTKLAEKKGSSIKAILKYIVANNKIADEAKAAKCVNRAIKKLVADKKFENMNGIHGKFRLPKAEPKLIKKVAAKKAPKKAKKPAAKKPAVKKVAAKKAPKKVAAKKAPKKAAKKAPAKKAPAKKAPAKKNRSCEGSDEEYESSDEELESSDEEYESSDEEEEYESSDEEDLESSDEEYDCDCDDEDDCECFRYSLAEEEIDY